MTGPALNIRTYRGPNGIGLVEAVQLAPENDHLVALWAGKVPQLTMGGWVVKTRGGGFVAFRADQFAAWLQPVPSGGPEADA